MQKKGIAGYKPKPGEPTTQSKSTSVPPEAIDGVLGRYKLCYELARGGMATVFLARMQAAEGFGKVVALKCIHPHLAAEPEFVQMFLDEARLASRISHPNVCSIIDFGNHGGTYYLALEFLLGEPLGRFLGRMQKDHKRPTDERVRLALYIVAQAAEGLHAAHELRADDGTLMKVVHRDVSPQNIFLTYQGGVSVLDFGVASAEGRMHETNAGQVKGKFAYMAPEQIGGNADRRSDVWSLGVCLWELLTVRKLFGQKTPAEQVRAATLDPIPLPSSIRKDIPKALDPIVMKALSRDPETRYQTAREFALALMRYAREHKGQVGMIELAECMSALFAVERGRKEQLVEFTRRNPGAGSVVATAPDLWQTQQGTPPPGTGAIGHTVANQTVERLAAEVDRLRADVSSRRRRALWLGLAAALVIGVTGFALYQGPLSGSSPEASAGNRTTLTNAPSEPSVAPTPPPAPVGTPEAPEGETAPATIGTENGAEVGTETDAVPSPTVMRPQAAPAARTRPNRIAARRPARPTESSEISIPRRPRRNAPAESEPTVAAAASPAPSNTEPEEEASRAATATPTEPSEPTPTAPNPEATSATAADTTPASAPRPTPVAPPAPAPPPVLDATVQITSVSVARGSLPAGDVSRAAARALDNYRNCYRSGARRAQRDANGAVTLRFEIDTRGRFRNVRASSFSLPGVSSCVAQASEGLRTRRAPDTGTAQTTMQVRFAVRRR